MPTRRSQVSDFLVFSTPTAAVGQTVARCAWPPASTAEPDHPVPARQLAAESGATAATPTASAPSRPPPPRISAVARTNGAGTQRNKGLPAIGVRGRHYARPPFDPLGRTSKPHCGIDSLIFNTSTAADTPCDYSHSYYVGDSVYSQGQPVTVGRTGDHAWIIASYSAVITAVPARSPAC